VYVTVKIYPHRREIIFTVWRRDDNRKAVKDDDSIHVELRGGRPRFRNNDAYASPVLEVGMSELLLSISLLLSINFFITD
jgi:hypothetical protein